ncbi:MarR family transcriptional regulator [Dysgonomonas sp. 216]|uniref:MarR family winged helix-turn-helix transcriptional regulator n=1 Tax=Dysgonomonas sp. 216 TaxID=2302934 RepID=UPI0013D73BF1|nr:MarR family winged helix-turn-helix transcriptional regulator [Dysgonomonas sp. 216]NDW17720.1 MarR family transcriptional regulator [Dysgonomonas sp. 216]
MKIEDEFKELDLIFPIINGKVSIAINRKLYRNFKKEGLDITPEQWTVLSFLWKEDGITQQVLCDATFKDKPSMTRLIDNLVKQKLVYRKTPPTDRRANLIYLTEAGHSIQERAEVAVYDTMKYALAGIDEKGIEEVRRLLKIVFDNLKESL